jgi:phosphatidylserine/phosphatidylglycerophosphate/cardiolipin synthase-like enzyme
MQALACLPRETRRALATALEAGRLGAPYTALAVRPYVGATAASAVAAALGGLDARGVGAGPLAVALGLVDAAEATRASASLVWSGPEVAGMTSRDTSVVARELFKRAERSVLVAGFAVHQGRRVFEELAARLTVPALSVRMFLNVERKKNDTASSTELLKRFADRFRDEQWPIIAGARMPDVYYDPRALELHVRGEKRAALHAKCIVVDARFAYVGSANFTEAAQERNIEAGALVEDEAFARGLVGQFEALVVAGLLRRLPGV